MRISPLMSNNIMHAKLLYKVIKITVQCSDICKDFQMWNNKKKSVPRPEDSFRSLFEDKFGLESFPRTDIINLHF